MSMVRPRWPRNREHAMTDKTSRPALHPVAPPDIEVVRVSAGGPIELMAVTGSGVHPRLRRPAKDRDAG
jgi:hypothetical protein